MLAEVETGPKTWTPSPRQQEFVRLPDECFEGFYGGAAFGGKSEVLIMLPIVKGWINHPQFQGIIFRRTFPQLEESLIPRSYEWYPAFGGKYNETKHVWTFPSGATIRFGFMEKDKDARTHDTAQYNYVAFDELTHFSEYQYRYITSRVRKSKAGLPSVVRGASNPGNIGHSWVRARFIEPAPQGGVMLLDPESQTYRIFIPAKLQDNPAGMAADPGYYNRLKLLPEAERRAKMDGDWWAFAGQVFSEFRVSHRDGEPESAVHVIPAFEIPSYWRRILFVDWGYRAMTYAGWLAIAPDDRVFLYREYSCKKKNISEWGADLARISRIDGHLETVIIDPSADQHRGQDKTILQQFIEASGFDYVEKADNDRISGKMLVHEFLRWVPKPNKYVPPEGFKNETYDRILRTDGKKSAKEYAEMFQAQEPELNIPRLQIFDTCTHMVNTIPLCTYNEDEVGNVEDVAEWSGDDPYDALRYGLKAAHRYLIDAFEMELRQKLGSIVQRYQTSHDTTQFYREMEAYDAERGSSKVVSISRIGCRPRRAISRRAV